MEIKDTMAVKTYSKYIFFCMAERKSVAAIWLFGVLWILSHPYLTFRAEVVVWLRNFRTCFTLITNLRKYYKRET